MKAPARPGTPRKVAAARRHRDELRAQAMRTIEDVAREIGERPLCQHADGRCDCLGDCAAPADEVMDGPNEETWLCSSCADFVRQDAP